MKNFKMRLMFFVVMVTTAVFMAGPVMAASQHLKVGVKKDPQNWDPMDTYRMDWSAVATSIFEGLVERDLDAKIKPGLAKSWKTFTKEKKIRFYLRKGVKFHDGSSFKADSVKFTFDRLLAPESKSPQKGNYDVIRKIKIINDYTVDFYLKELDPVLIVKLSSYAGVIVPKSYIERRGDTYFNTHPVGTGPFKLSKYVVDQKMEVVRFEDYWKKPLTKLDKVTFKFIPEASTRLAELQTANVDISSQVSLNQSEAIVNAKDIDLIKSDSPTVYAIRFDVLKKEVADVRVREAIALAIDIDTIIETVLQGNGRRINSFQSKLSFGYDSALPLRPYDPEKAKRLLKEAGYDFSKTLLFRTSASDPTFKEVAQAVQLYLKMVGVKFKLETVEYNVFLSEMIPNRKAGHMFRQGWGGWTLDFDNTAYSLYHKGTKWCPDYYDAKVEELLTAERSTMDPAVREKIFSKMSKRLYDTIPDIPLYQAVNLWGVNKRVKGFQAPADGRMRFEKVYIAD